jgi:predicted O-methyltransferase YrrM
VHVKLFQLKTFITYWLDAVEAYSLHSPFIFDFYTHVVKSKKDDNEFLSLKQIRKQLASDHRMLDVVDLGAGSQHLKNSKRKISDIAATSIAPEKLSLLYARLIRHYKCKNILELGTSLGINTLYLAHATESAQVTTFEGSPSIAVIAQELFDKNSPTMINLVKGNINETLPVNLATSKDIDFALIDANHRFEPTLHYFDLLCAKSHHQTIIVVDDIHYSTEMSEAWREIQQRELVFCTVDLYRCGIVFLDPSLNKQNFVLQF